VSELGITNTYRQDSGIYICQAGNSFGQDEMSIHLIVQEVPEPPKTLRINSQQSRSLQLSWSQPFAGNSPILEYNVQYKMITDNWQAAERITVTGTQTVITIQNLRPAKAYHIRVSAENKLGTSEFSEIVQITTLEEVPSGPPLNVRGEPKSSTEIHLNWDAPERDQWNGNLLGYYVGYQLHSNSNELDPSPTQGFNFKTVEVRSHFGGDTTLQNLNKYSQYNIVVQAYTSQGSGPPSKEITMSTLEDGEWIFFTGYNKHSTFVLPQYLRVLRIVQNVMSSHPHPSMSHGPRHRLMAATARSRVTRCLTLPRRTCTKKIRWWPKLPINT
jgi:Fibronectin type III domain